jgi:hypothetical protein
MYILRNFKNNIFIMSKKIIVIVKIYEKFRLFKFTTFMLKDLIIYSIYLFFEKNFYKYFKNKIKSS